MLTTTEEGVCRVLDRRGLSSRKVLVVVASSANLRKIHNMVAASLPVGSECTGSTWYVPDGTSVEVLAYEDNIPAGRTEPYDIEVCNAGVTLTPAELDHLKRWRALENA